MTAATSGSEPPLEVVTESVGEGCRISAKGEVDIGTAPGLASALEAAEASGAVAIVLDLSGVTFIDSTGLSVLVRGALRSEEGNRLSIVASPSVDRVVDLTGLRDRLPLV